MTIFCRLLAVLVFILFGYADEPARADLLVADKQKVAFLGDSITQFGWQNPWGYVQLVVSGFQTLGVNVVPVPAGVAGNTSKDMLARLDPAVLSQHPDWMTLSCGVNDVWHQTGGVNLDDYKKNITSIVDQAQAKGIKVTILTSTMIYEDLGNDFNKKLLPYNDFLRQLAKNRNLPLADLNASFQTAIQGIPKGERKYFTIDGIHMNPYGDRIMAEGVLRALGANDDQILRVKTAWDQQSYNAVITAQMGLDGHVKTTFPEYDRFCQTALAQGRSPTQVTSDLLVRAWREVLKAHAQDLSFPDPDMLRAEVDQQFNKQVQEYLTNPPPSPSSVVPESSPAVQH
jgi:lysophospholipase L1-like esterase